jgi:hypothetical protein
MSLHAAGDRIICPEWLDDMEPSEKLRSLQDLIRINRFLGGHQALRDTLATLVSPSESFSFLDIGAASGDTGEVVHKQYPNARVISLDYRLHHLRAAASPKIVADAFALPIRDAAVDFVHCSLFLHHFADEQVTTLLRDFGRIARRAVIVNDLERHPLPYYFLPATKWLFRWDPITLHDGPISVEAGFHRDELEARAREAGLQHVKVSVHRPAFRLVLVARSELGKGNDR